VAAAGVATLMFVSNDQILPRANQRLAAVQAGRAVERSNREMTIAELRTAARVARADAASASAARAASYEVEIQKKYALSAACVVLALTGVALALLSPHDGVALAIVAFPNVIAMYYVALIAGEALANRLLVSPFVAMWMGNALLLAAALLVVWWRSRGPDAPRGAESLAIGA
jgi:lipopolysaccharide export system permease protein